MTLAIKAKKSSCEALLEIGPAAIPAPVGRPILGNLPDVTSGRGTTVALWQQKFREDRVVFAQSLGEHFRPLVAAGHRSYATNLALGLLSTAEINMPLKWAQVAHQVNSWQDSTMMFSIHAGLEAGVQFELLDWHKDPSELKHRRSGKKYGFISISENGRLVLEAFARGDHEAMNKILVGLIAKNTPK